jgi:plasmid stabilization system protein ParE
MPRFAVEFHPLAADEAQAAERWYRERNETASGRFQRELDRAIDRISERPEAGPRISVTPGAYYFAAIRSSSCIAYAASTLRSLPSRMHGGGRDIGGHADRRFPVVRKAKLTSTRRKAFAAARRRALARLRGGLYLQWTPPRTREAVHDRAAQKSDR